MKRLTFTVMVIVSLLAITGCGPAVIGSGKLETESYEYTGFTMIEASDGFHLTITESPSYKIEVTADDNIKQYVEVELSGETIEIKLNTSGIFTSTTLQATISMPELAGVKLSGGSVAVISGFNSSTDFSVTLSGGSRLEGEIVTGDIGFGLSGGSIVTLTGSGKNLVARSSGGSIMDMETFPINDADINISGGGRAFLDISGILYTDLSGGSRLVYRGNPEMGNVNLSGGSILEKE